MLRHLQMKRRRKRAKTKNAVKKYLFVKDLVIGLKINLSTFTLDRFFMI